MHCVGHAKHRKRRLTPWPALAFVLLLIAFGCITVGLRGQDVALPGPVAAQDAPVVAAPGTASGTTPGTASDATPGTASDATPGTASDTTPGTGTGVLPSSRRAESPVAAGRTAPLPAPAGPAATSAPPPSQEASAVARSAAVALRIPAIAVSVPLSELGLNADQTVQVPTNFAEPGWFQPGPSPGQVGSAVILGHVDSYKGPAVFFRLRELRAGDQVDVSLADGAVAHFVVNTVAMYPKEQFPAQEVYASHGGSALQLVTCGGSFDTQTRSYLSNVVAYTSLRAVTPAARK